MPFWSENDTGLRFFIAAGRLSYIWQRLLRHLGWNFCSVRHFVPTSENRCGSSMEVVNSRMRRLGSDFLTGDSTFRVEADASLRFFDIARDLEVRMRQVLLTDGLIQVWTTVRLIQVWAIVRLSQVARSHLVRRSLCFGSSSICWSNILKEIIEMRCY